MSRPVGFYKKGGKTRPITRHGMERVRGRPKNTLTAQKTLVRPEFMRVSEIPYDGYIFVSDSQDIEPIKEQFKTAKEFDGFFVPKRDLEHGEITYVYGISGSIPETHKTAYLIRS